MSQNGGFLIMTIVMSRNNEITCTSVQPILILANSVQLFTTHFVKSINVKDIGNTFRATWGLLLPLKFPYNLLIKCEVYYSLNFVKFNVLANHPDTSRPTADRTLLQDGFHWILCILFKLEQRLTLIGQQAFNASFWILPTHTLGISECITGGFCTEKKYLDLLDSIFDPSRLMSGRSLKKA